MGHWSYAPAGAPLARRAHSASRKPCVDSLAVPATAAKFIPKVTKYVGKVGGKDVGALLSSALR
jgi:hypothetical protein